MIIMTGDDVMRDLAIIARRYPDHVNPQVMLDGDLSCAYFADGRRCFLGQYMHEMIGFDINDNLNETILGIVDMRTVRGNLNQTVHFTDLARRRLVEAQAIADTGHHLRQDGESTPIPWREAMTLLWESIR